MARESEKHKRMVESVRLREENEKLKATLRNIKLYLSEKVNFSSNDFLKAQSNTAQLKAEAKQGVYSEILNFIKGKGY